MRRESIGERIHRLRSERGLSQRDLEQPGISSGYISRIETGARAPSAKALQLLAARLATTALYLETGDPDAPCPHCGRHAGGRGADEPRPAQSPARDGHYYRHVRLK